MKINIKEITSKVNGESVSGVVYVKNANINVAKNGKKYIQGLLIDNKESIFYKVWGDYMEAFQKVNATSQILYIEGTVNVFNDTTSIVITKAMPSNEGLTPADFITGHDRDALEREFYEINKRLLSPNAYDILNVVVRDKVKDRFFMEYAGMTMHDACPSGVANHTVKMLRILETIINNDPRLAPWTDLLVLGVDLHDVGKIKEMYNGNYRKNSFVTHREFGIELLMNNKDFIASQFNDDFYYRLVSIIRGHHDEFEEKAKTVYAYITFLIDMLDSQVSHILDCVEAENLKEESSGDSYIQSHDHKLYV